MINIKITPKQEIDEYFESDALNQSSLKSLQYGMNSFLKEQEKRNEISEKECFLIGSAVDCMLTGGKDDFEKSFFVSTLGNKPSETEMKITETIFNVLVDIRGNETSLIEELSSFPGVIKVVIDEENWQPKWKDQTRIDKIIEKCSDYFEDLKSAFGKKILSLTQFDIVSNVVNSLLTNERTRKFFDKNQINDEIDLVIMYQLPVYFNSMVKLSENIIETIPCKALLDIVLIFKEKKDNQERNHYYVQPVDLKTMSGNTLNFPSNLKSFRYDLQAAWYVEALTNKSSSFKKIFSDNDTFELKPFLFIVESTTEPGTPLVYELSQNLLTIGKKGRDEIKLTDVEGLFSDTNYEDIIIMPRIVGFEELLQDYLYYQYTEWKEDKKIAESEGRNLIISWDKVI